jgi:hypothetical protein
MCALLGRVLVLHAVVASVCGLTIPASGCEIITHSYTEPSKDSNDCVMTKTVSMSLFMPPSFKDSNGCSPRIYSTEIFKHLQRNKRVSKSLLCFVCAVADLSSGTTPLTMLFQHWGLPQYTYFLFPELHFILNNVVKRWRGVSPGY